MSGSQSSPVARGPRRWSRLLTLALLLSAVYFAVQTLAPHTIGETARRKLLLDLQSHYRGHSISIRRGHYDPKVGLTFEDVRIADRSASFLGRGTREMLRIERLTVLADIDPEKLLDRSLPLTTRGIVMDGVHATLWLTENQQISLAELWPLPKLGPVAPRMVMRNVSIGLLSATANRRPIAAELEEVLVTSHEHSNGQVDRVVAIKGSADFADGLLLRVDCVGDTIDLRGTIKGAHLSRDLFDRLPEPWSDRVRHVQHLQCECDATLALRRSADGRVNYHARTTVHDGRLEHPMLTKPLSELRGVVTCTPAGITIEASQGTFGDAIVRATGKLGGYAWPCETNLSVSTRGLLLDDRLEHSLPSTMQTAWNRLQPYGRVDIDAQLTHSGSGWQSNASVVCKGVDVRYERFPYPIESLVGRIEIVDGVAVSETLTGRVGGNHMRCKFALPIFPGVVAAKSFAIDTDGPIPIDKTLLGSLSPRGAAESKLETFVRSLRPRGSLQLASATFATDESGHTTRRMDLRIIDGHLRYENFAYPLYNVSGSILVDGDLVTIAGMRATNANAGTIRCEGTYRMPVRVEANSTGARFSSANGNDLSHLSLRFDASDIPMDESLRSSLPANSQQIWDAIAPGGVLDELRVAVQQHGTAGTLDLDLTATQHESPQVTSRTLSLRPTSLPYRLDVTGGRVRFDGKTVTIDSIRGRHDASTLSADGLCVQDSGDRWELLLNLHSGSRLHPDAELIAALPSQMRVAMRALQLRGPVSVRGQTRVALPDMNHPEPAIQWDLVLQLEGNRIADVGPVHSLRGELSIQGHRDEASIRALGDVRIDSMHVHGIQITGIRGPFSIEGDMLLLGSEARASSIGTDEQVATQRPSIRGRLFDGAIDLDGMLVLSSGNFDVGMTIHQAQLPTLLADFGHSDKDLTGTLSGQSQLQGNLGTSDLLKGNGAARVTGANLYKLPLIVQVLNLLRIKATEDVAFTDGAVEFTLFGDTVTFSDLHIWGDLVALQGGGTLNRRRELDLTFNTRVSPQNSFTQLVSPLGQRYTLWTIDVQGPLHDLKIERKALDRVSETLEWLIPGRAEGGTRPGPQAARGPAPEQTISPMRRLGGWFD